MRYVRDTVNDLLRSGTLTILRHLPLNKLWDPVCTSPEGVEVGSPQGRTKLHYCVDIPSVGRPESFLGYGIRDSETLGGGVFGTTKV